MALRETLQQFRHSVETLSRLRELYDPADIPPAEVPTGWREKRVLAPARIWLGVGVGLAEYEDPVLLRLLEKELTDFLHRKNVERLDISTLRSKDREVTQRVGRFLHDRGYAGVVFPSSIPPGGPCVALFEGRARLEATGAGRPLTDSFSTLRRVCREFDLALS